MGRASLGLETFLVTPQWQRETPVLPADGTQGGERWLIFCEISDELATELSAQRCIFLSATGSLAQRYADYVVQLSEHLRQFGERRRDVMQVQLVLPETGEGVIFQGLHALLLSAAREYPHVQIQTISVVSMAIDMLLERLEQVRWSTASRLRCTADGYEVLKWQAHPGGRAETLWKHRGVYWITGGLGGLGRVFAEAITREVEQPVLILSGRSRLTEAHRQFAATLQAQGATVELQALDITDRRDVEALLASILQRHGRLDGLIHAAGVLQDQLLRNLDEAAVRQVLAAKVKGLEILDDATRGIALDWLLLCSSLASVTGNLGQSAYAAANGFLDGFARYRQVQVARGERQGRTLSIDWPLWDGIGMQVDATVRDLWRDSSGLVAMPREEGLSALARAAASGDSQVLVLHGERERLLAAVNRDAPPVSVKAPAPSTTPVQHRLAAVTRSYLKEVFAGVLKLSAARIDDKATLDRYGIDSIRAMALTRALQTRFGALPATLFFEYRSIEALTDYLLEHHRKALLDLLPHNEVVALPSATGTAAAQAPRGRGSERRTRLRGLSSQRPTEPAGDRLDIAIIGLSGRYPQAHNLALFWRNLAEGRDCITEIPAERWDWRDYFDSTKGMAGKSYGKWGGFLDGVDCFDPLFFNISPREAKRLDPQERLFLQSAYHAIEDAGYTRNNLAADGAVGVFVGVMSQDYQLHSSTNELAISSHASIANRVSYFCDFQGPSLTLDTMCSSSLTAIHLACRSLRQKECRVAIAGGVNLSIHPYKYLMLAQGRFMSTDGRCVSFGEGGDGYVPGEGVGAVVLKPLEQAISEGDHIYGVIKGSALNHGGRTNGYTVPNPNAQSAVIERALQESRVDVRAISYLEAHGTGTALGDPIEIVGLSQAFAGHTQARQFCAVGSVKSNIGHCEGAAGIAGLTKVLLQMQHGELVPSLHSETLNRHIDFSATPFVVQRQRAAWVRPLIDGREQPRIAGLSSFGAGGSNAHLIIEEYQPATRLQTQPDGPALILLSARDGNRLQACIEQLADYLDEHEVNLADLAWTLQVGREAMNTRLALLVASPAELRETLRALGSGRPLGEHCYRGEIDRSREQADGDEDRDEAEQNISEWIAQGELGKLAEAWVDGLTVDWAALYGRRRPQRLSLPGYPFAEDHYWITLPAEQGASLGVTLGHPLLQRNVSDFSGLRFSTTLRGDEFFLRDHVVQGKPIVPAVVQLEWARAAVRLALGESAANRPVALHQVAWLSPLRVEAPTEVVMTLALQDDGSVQYELGSGTAAEHQLYCRGRAQVLADDGNPGAIDIAAELAACTRQTDVAELYARFAAAGLSYGPALRTIQALHSSAGTVMARLQKPAGNPEADFTWSAGLLDGALQSGAVLLRDNALSLPFSVSQVRDWGTLPDDLWVRVQATADDVPGLHKWDITLAADDGRVLLQLDGCSLRTLMPPAGETLLATRAWSPSAMPAQAPVTLDEHWVVFCEIPGLPSLQARLQPMHCIRLAESGSLAQRYTAYVQRLVAVGRSFAQQKATMQRALQLLLPSDEDTAVLEGLGALLRSLQQEITGLRTQLLVLDNGAQADVERGQIDLGNELASGDQQVRYIDGARHVPGWKVAETSAEAPLWHDGGVYWITGGLGGLGRLMAQDIAALGSPVIILNGRRQPDSQQQAFIQTLQARGASVEFHAVDVTDAEAMSDLAQGIMLRHGRLDGIVHSAGVLRDHLLRNMSDADLDTVLAVKVAGLLALDEATRDIPLGWMLLCSSIAALWPAPGQSAYAAGNGFLDGYARFRQALVARGERQGRTVSVNWPLWDEGGMRMDENGRLQMKRLLGLDTLPSRAGLQAMARAVDCAASQVVVVHGERGRLLELLDKGLNDIRKPSAERAQAPTPAGSNDELLARVERIVGDMMAEHLQLPLEALDRHTPFLEFGFDSVTLTSFGHLLQQRFGLSLSTTVFFEAPTLAELARYLVHEFADELAVACPVADDNPLEADVAPVETAPAILPCAPVHVLAQSNAQEPVAVIGMSGCFPRAADIDALWANLLANRDCIGELPLARWQPGQAPSLRHAGIIDEIDCFDPLFFGISPREAQVMDPQQRLLMQHVYQVIEDAGYSVQSLSGSDTALLVGTGATGYGRLLNLADGVRGYHAAGIASAMGPNRMSYWLNWHGPSEPVDTACSSSLVAIHRAVGLLRSGQCAQAVVGGVNTILSSEMHESFNQAGMLSPAGRCRTFSALADGYVRGEGVGMLFLKPLTAAECDGDHIYGLITGSAQNHGGRSASLTAPNPAAQARLIERAFRDAGVAPETVGYIEAHGTGTPLGDPIEIRGLALAFEQLAEGRTLPAGYCGLGSVKSNIGHLELAAGVAGVIKVLLQLQARQLVASINHAPLNPDICLDGTPFHIVTANQPWQPMTGPDGQPLPLRAGVSSFGFGGVNAHVLLEEYRPRHQQEALPATQANPYAMPAA